MHFFSFFDYVAVRTCGNFVVVPVGGCNICRAQGNLNDIYFLMRLLDQQHGYDDREATAAHLRSHVHVDGVAMLAIYLLIP